MVSVKVLVGLTLVVLACITPLTSAMGCGLPCSQRVLSKCIRPTGCELAKRPCGCCPTCALKEGDLCGAWTSWCQKGLWCYSGMMRLGFERVPPELFQFRGICTKKPGFETHHKLNDPTNPTSITHQGTTLPSGITYGKVIMNLLLFCFR
ncbi:insulin-like growth factor-binding protein 5 [Lingula anatina]|uniref:Insulin-like growth factor-binding protein 5 n=1 Tax=Lingula anatina TaxID=7574 RepID=A0A1S3KCC6_LINAN|nr:insulin-like growth factor-binding protein 5 [Lingula anatina]|eukprot:XP_013419911.1 insulin-like growth factor-binding protein 5 [Lingula anatina]